MRLSPPRLTLLLCAASLVVVVLAGAWVVGTESGLVRVLALARLAPGVTVTARDVRGTLVGGFTIGELVIDQERARVTVRRVRARLDPSGALMLRLRLPEVTADEVDVAVRSRTHPPDHVPVYFLPGPMSVVVERLAVGTIAIHTAAGASSAWRQVAARVAVTHSRVALLQLSAASGDLWLKGTAALASGDPLGLDTTLEVGVNGEGRDAAATVTGSGTLEAIAVHVTTRRPAGLGLDGRLQLDPAVRYDGALSLDRYALGTGGDRLSGQLAVHGAIDALSVAGDLAVAGPRAMRLAVTAEGGYAGDVIEVRRFDVAVRDPPSAGAMRLAATGRVGLGGPLRIEADAHWSGLRWPLAARVPEVESPAGSVHVAGESRFDFDLDATVRRAGLPPAAISVRGSADAQRLTARALEARIAGGRIAGRGEIGLATPRPWQFEVRASAIDPGAFRPALHGRIAFALDAEGQGFEPLGRWRATLSRLEGSVRGLPAEGRGTVAALDGNLRFDDARLKFGSANLEASGDLGRREELRWRLRVDRLGDFLPDAGGRLRSEGSASGDLAHLVAHGGFTAHDLAFGAWHAADVSAVAQLDATGRGPSSLLLRAHGAGRGDNRADDVSVTLAGPAHAHTLAVRAHGRSMSVELASRGQFRDGRWTLSVDALRTSGVPELSYSLAEPSTFTLDSRAASLTRTCLVREASRLCAEGDWSAERPWSASLEATALPLRLGSVRMPKDTEYRGSWAARATVAGAPGRPWTGNGAVTLEDGEFRYRGANGRPVVVRFGNGHAEIRVTPASVDGAMGLATEGGSYLAGSAELGRDDRPLADAPLKGVVSMSTTELGALPLFVAGVDRVAGRLEAELELSGTAGAPLVAGRAHFLDGELDLYRTNLLLRETDLRLALDGDTLDVAGTTKTRGGSASANGRIAWHDRAAAGTLDFKGDHLLVADLPEARVTASPDLHFVVDRGRITVRGDVTIPSAKIAPRDLRSAVVASSDERIVGEDRSAPGAGLAVDASVRLILGDDVAIDAYGLKGKLGGNLVVTARKGEVASGSGEFNIREGKYTAYTRELDIDRGRLLFAGQSLGNPGLDIRAQKVLPTVTAGINVRGTLLQPEISFYSDQSLSQSQIAAILIVGKTLDDIQSSDKSTIGGLDTRNALLAQGSAVLAGQLGRYVGINDVGIETGTNNVTSLVVGKFLTPRLYVSYGVSLTQAINTLKLRYTIGDRWVIKTESGTSQSADIEYTIEH